MSEVKDNQLTIAAIAVIAMCLSTVAHEAVGHGGVCLLSGGHIAQLTSVYFQCQPSPWFVAAAGPLGNLVWATLAALIAYISRGRVRVLFTLTALFSLLWEAGYMLYAAITNDGDYIFALRGLLGAVTAPARVALVVVGAGLYFVAIAVARALLRPFATTPSRVREILRTAWLAATAATCAAALLYAPDRSSALTQAFLEIGAASAALMLMRRDYVGGNAPTIGASSVWLVAAVLIYATFALTLGRGISA
jgi:hypothetical protein